LAPARRRLARRCGSAQALVGVRVGDHLADLARQDAAGRELIQIHPDIDLAYLAAIDGDRTNAAGLLQARDDRVIDQRAQLKRRAAVLARDCDRQDRLLVGVEFLIERVFHPTRQARERGTDLVAHVLHGLAPIDGALELNPQ